MADVVVPRGAVDVSTTRIQRHGDVTWCLRYCCLRFVFRRPTCHCRPMLPVVAVLTECRLRKRLGTPALDARPYLQVIFTDVQVIRSRSVALFLFKLSTNIILQHSPYSLPTVTCSRYYPYASPSILHISSAIMCRSSMHLKPFERGPAQ